MGVEVVSCSVSSVMFWPVFICVVKPLLSIIKFQTTCFKFQVCNLILDVLPGGMCVGY